MRHAPPTFEAQAIRGTDLRMGQGGRKIATFGSLGLTRRAATFAAARYT